MLRRVAPIFFFASGVAGLLMQVAWFRLLALGLGGTLAAATVVLVAFMAGLALGAGLLSRRAASVRDPLRAYGYLELAAASAALITLPLLRGLDGAFGLLARSVGPHPEMLLLVKLVLAGAMLLPATTAMGGTLPVLCHALIRRPEGSGTRTGSLYALNTWGAVAGSLLAIFIVMPRLGLSACVIVGACIDLAVGLAVLALARRREESVVAAPTPAPADQPMEALRAPIARLLPGLLAAVGAAGLAYEILWTRALAFYFGSGAHGFALMLAVVLTGLALGAFLGGAASDRVRQPLLVLALSQVLLGIAVAYQAWWMPRLPEFLYGLALRAGRLTFGTLAIVMLLGTVQLLLPATILMGAALPSAVRSVLRMGDASGAVVGRLYAANCLGTIPGAILAAWVFIPMIGLQRSLLLVAGMNLVVGLVATTQLSGLSRRIVVTAAVPSAALLLAAAAMDPGRIFAGSGVFVDAGGKSTLLRLRESPHGTVTLSKIDDDRGSWLSLAVDGINVAGTSPALLACQELQGHLPLLLHRAPRSILHIGFGSGGTAAAVATHPEIERIDIVEINPAILRMSDESLRPINGGVLQDPRVHVHLEDGRNWLLGTKQHFDCILSDSVHPRYRGNSSLYTVEYFRLCRSRLNPGGLVSTWLPIYSLSPDSLRSIVASMREVFPATSVWYLNSTVNEFVILVGRLDEDGISAARMDAAFREPTVVASLARVGVLGPADVLDYFVAEGAELDDLQAGVKLHHDDRPWVELESATVLNRDASWAVNLGLVLRDRHSVLPHLIDAGPQLVDELRLRERATELMLPAHLAYLLRDSARIETSKAAALAVDPSVREPWDFFAPPDWVREVERAVVAPSPAP